MRLGDSFTAPGGCKGDTNPRVHCRPRKKCAGCVGGRRGSTCVSVWGKEGEVHQARGSNCTGRQPHLGRRQQQSVGTCNVYPLQHMDVWMRSPPALAWRVLPSLTARPRQLCRWSLLGLLYRIVQSVRPSHPQTLEVSVPVPSCVETWTHSP